MTCRLRRIEANVGPLNRVSRRSIAHLLHSPHDSRHASEKLPNAERLGEVVVGTVHQREHFVRLGGRARDDKDGGIGIDGAVADCPAEGDAVEAGERGVEHDEIEARTGQTLERVPPVDALVDFEAIGPEMVREQLSRWLIAVSDKRSSWCIRQASAAVQTACPADPRRGDGPALSGRSESKGSVENVWRALSSFQRGTSPRQDNRRKFQKVKPTVITDRTNGSASR